MISRKKRIPTKPTKSSKEKRLDSKSKHSKLKALRKKIDRTTFVFFSLISLLLFSPLESIAQKMIASKKSTVTVYPNPKILRFIGKSFFLGSESEILIHANPGEIKAANYFKRLIADKFSVNLHINIIAKEENISGRLKIHLRLKPNLPNVPNSQYYKIDFVEEKREINVYAPSQLGLLYGVVTLSDFFYLAGDQVILDLFEVEDWPIYQRRIFPVIPDLSTLDELMDFALRYKLETIALGSRRYSWKKVDQTFADVMDKIKDWQDRFGGPHIMQSHNIYVGDKIVISNPDDINGLKRVIETGIVNGATKLMILADDTPPFKFGEGYILTDENDKKKFPHMAAAHCYLVNELMDWIKEKSYDCEVYFVPAFYTFEDAKYGDIFLYEDTPWEEAAFGPLNRDLNYIGKNMSDDIFIVWTGPNVRSRTITEQNVNEWTEFLAGRVPFLWDNTIYSHHPFTTTALFTAYENDLPKDFPKITAGNGMFINGNSNSEGMQVAAMTTNDFLWDPDRYDPHKSQITAMQKKYGKKSTKLLLDFKDIEMSLRKKIGERALWFKSDTLWHEIIDSKLITSKNPFHYHFNYSRLKALRMQLKHSVPQPSSEKEFIDECRVLQKERDGLLEEIKSSHPDTYVYLKSICIPADR